MVGFILRTFNSQGRFCLQLTMYFSCFLSFFRFLSFFFFFFFLNFSSFLISVLAGLFRLGTYFPPGVITGIKHTDTQTHTHTHTHTHTQNVSGI